MLHALHRRPHFHADNSLPPVMSQLTEDRGEPLLLLELDAKNSHDVREQIDFFEGAKDHVVVGGSTATAIATFDPSGTEQSPSFELSSQIPPNLRRRPPWRTVSVGVPGKSVVEIAFSSVVAVHEW
jgi:hypothetical protein